MQRALGVGDSEDLEEHELLEAIARRNGTLVVVRVWGSSVSAPLLAVCRRDGTLVSASKNGPPRMTATSLSDELKSDAEAVAVFEAASDSLYLPLSPCISLFPPSIFLYLPLPPSISLYLPLSPSISLYLPLSPSISLYLPLSPSISLYLPLPPSTSLYLPLPPSISLYLPLPPSISLYLPLSPSTSGGAARQEGKGRGGPPGSRSHEIARDRTRSHEIARGRGQSSPHRTRSHEIGGRSYTAIVLNGGADSFNMLVPHSNCGDHGDLFQGYAMLGTSQPCLKALCCRSVSPQACSTFGLREKLEELYDAGEALWLANVGAMMGWGEMGRDGEVAADFQVAPGCHPRHPPPPPPNRLMHVSPHTASLSL